jgi:hypothetical protein
MKRLFMRTLWGEYDNSHRITQRRELMDGWLGLIKRNQYNAPFITYVFGEENYKVVQDLGFDCKLIDKNPLPFDAIKAQYRHKLEAMRYAFDEDGCDELVHMDWDVFPTKELPDDFWETLGKKGHIQSCLQQYKRKKCFWRKDRDKRKVSNGGFVYMRDKTAPSEIIKIWERKPGPSMEPAMSRYLDEQMDGWKGREYYWDHHEPDFCNLHKDSVYASDKERNKNICFIHYQGGNKNVMLNRVKRKYRSILNKGV